MPSVVVATKTSELAIDATGVPRAVAAWAAVRAASSRTTTSAVTPAGESAARTRATEGWSSSAGRCVSVMGVTVARGGDEGPVTGARWLP